MRIAVANAGICLSKGGSERAAIRLAMEMIKRGHDARLLAVQSPLPPQYKLDPLLPVHFFPDSFFNPALADLASLSGLLKKLGIEAVAGFESDAKHVLWGRLCKEANIPYICSERNSPELIEREFWNPDGRRAFLKSCARVHELLPAYLPLVPDGVKSFAIPNAAPQDLPVFLPEWEGNQPVLLYLGRFDKQKRLDLLIRAFAIVTGEFPLWRLRLAGWGEMEKQLRALAARLGLGEKIEIRPACPDVGKEYLAADAYCLPSQNEGFPNTVLEAMGHGLPVVGAADCPAMRSIIRPGKNGLLAAEGSPRALADALRPLLASPALRKTIGSGARRDCLENYNAEKIFDQWETEFANCIKDFSSRSV